MDKKLTILTTAHSQQIAVLNVANILSGVPPSIYERRFYPYSMNRFMSALLVSFLVLNL